MAFERTSMFVLETHLLGFSVSDKAFFTNIVPSDTQQLTVSGCQPPPKTRQRRGEIDYTCIRSHVPPLILVEVNIPSVISSLENPLSSFFVLCFRGADVAIFGHIQEPMCMW